MKTEVNVFLFTFLTFFIHDLSLKSQNKYDYYRLIITKIQYHTWSLSFFGFTEKKRKK